MIQTVINQLEALQADHDAAWEIKSILQRLRNVQDTPSGLANFAQKNLIPTYGNLEFQIGTEFTAGHDFTALHARKSALLAAIRIILEMLVA